MLKIFKYVNHKSFFYFKALLIYSILIFFTSKSSAQENLLEFKHLTSNNGLSQNFISSIIQDRSGFIWIGTKDGLNRYDGYEFKVYRNKFNDSTSLSSNFVSAIYEDSRGRLWVGSSSLDLFLPEKDAFKRIKIKLPYSNTDVTNNVNKITSIVEDKYGLLWLGTTDGLISYDPQTGNFRVIYQDQEHASPLYDNWILSLSSDDSLLFVGTQNGLKSLDINSYKNGKIRFVKINHPEASDLMTSKRSILCQLRVSTDILYAGTPSGLIKIYLPERKSEFIPYKGYNFAPLWLNRILAIVRDKDANLWLACSGGLVIFNTINKSFKFYFQDPKDERSLSLSSLTSMYSDRGGKIWVGTAGKGLNVLDQNRKDFILYEGLVDKEPFKSSFSVTAIFLDDENYLWISSQQKLFKLNRTTKEYKRFNLIFGPEGEISSIIKDDKNNIWISTSGGLYKVSKNDGNITRYSHNPTNPNSLKDDFVRLLFKDREGNIYALNSKYLSKYDEHSNSFTHFELNFSGDKNEIPIIRSIYQSADGYFWFGWYEGLVKYNLTTKEKTIFKHSNELSNSISNNEVLAICEDPVQPKKYLWIGTHGGGLNRLDLEDNSISNFTVENGLPNNVVYGILSSGSELWLSTNNGLSRVITDKYGTPSFRNYDISDGLQGNEFNTGAYFKSDTGELFFGGLNGVTAFYPSRIKDNLYVPPVLFTSLKFLNTNYSKTAADNSKMYVEDLNSPITIPYSMNSFTVQFAALDYTAPQKNRYMYKLKPVNKDWIDLGTQRDVTFTELGSGEYELVIRGSNNDGIWNQEGATLKIIVKPPIWRSPWAYAIYGVLIMILLLFIRKYELTRIKLKNRLKQESFETQKLKELDEMKSSFFANISHEFRTPLTLIIAPSEQLARLEKDESKKEKLQIIKNSAFRLMKLVNQILDLSKLEKRKLKLYCTENELVSFIKGITSSFLTIAEKKNIDLSFNSNKEEIKTYFDKDVFEKIFYNLLSNALKFTKPGGKVAVNISYPILLPDNKENNNFINISITDSGIGISKSDLQNLFNKFFTAYNNNNLTEQGSGIGLALVKELVELHKGKIFVQSRLNEGSEFSVFIPYGKDFLNEDELILEKIEENTNVQTNLDDFIESDLTDKVNENEVFEASENDDQLIVLVVEDNFELRKYIGTCLKPDYKIIEASNGNEGLNKAIEEIPDLIISDIMMPEMDGYSLSKKLKTDVRTSHIPVILLTAKATEEDKLNGLELGVDDYLTKPFSSKELTLRVKNLIGIRQTLRKKFSSSIVIKPKEITTGSLDKLFLEKAIKIVEKNISNEKFSVENFSYEMNLSHSQLHRKLRALINQSAIQFIRSIRMQRALEMIQKNSGTISEIAWEVGFNDPSYFTKIFSKHFGFLPSETPKN